MSNIYQPHSNKLVSANLEFFITLNQAFSAISRRFDHMGSMLGFNDFVILYHLMSAEDNKLRRIDLADKTGLTASGVTRLLLPLEKLKLVGRESDPRDGRISYAVLTSGGKRIFTEAIERAEYVADTIASEDCRADLARFASVLNDMRRRSL